MTNLRAPLVSIVIAAYQPQQRHVAAAVRSALDQTWPSLEILVGDDSPDDLLRQHIEELGDARIRYVHHKPGLGVARNHWEAFSRARGEFIAVLNHDDLLAPTMVERLMVGLAQHPEVTISFCDHHVIDEDGTHLAEESERNSVRWGRSGLAPGLHTHPATLVMRQSIPVAMGAVLRRNALPAQLPAHAGPAYDLWLSFLLIREGGSVWYEPKRLSSWRTHAGNLTSAAGVDWLQGSATCWRAISEHSRFTMHAAAARRRAAQTFGSASLAALRYGRSSSARQFARDALALHLCARSAAIGALAWLPLSLSNRLIGGRE